MNVQQAYNKWAEQYDTNENKTRDLEAQALRLCLKDIDFNTCLEIGCGTGKNTEWLMEKANYVLAIDLSEEMLIKARSKITPPHVEFKQADITQSWNFSEIRFDLISFSLVLEHIENFEHIFQQASALLNSGGYIYIGELHPFKQYTGTKARFDTSEGTQVVQCYDHHMSDFVLAAKKYGLTLVDINEFFDDNDRTTIPRVLTIIFRNR